MKNDIEISVTWVQADKQLYQDGTLIRPFARILRPEVFEATRRSRQAIALADRILNTSKTQPRLNETLRRKMELEAELAQVNAVLGGLGSEGQSEVG